MAKKKSFFKTRKNLLIIGATAGVLIVASVVYYFHFSSGSSSVSGTITSSSPNPASNPSNQTDKNNSVNSDSSTPNNNSDKSQSSNAPSSGNQSTLSEAPTGTFVSNHNPRLSVPSSLQEQSACNTLAGAVCYIQFTKNGAVKSLDSKVADKNGAVIWNWDVKTAGLDQGEWTITATATLNGQSKTSTDGLKLIVQP